MKKTVTGFLITGIILFILGISLLLAGIGMGLSWSGIQDVWSNRSFLFFDRWDGNRYTSSDSFKFEADNIHEIEVDMKAGILEIRESSDAYIRVDIQGRRISDLRSELDGDTLKIKNDSVLRRGKIMLYLPAGVVWDHLDIELGAGEGRLYDPIRTKELSVDIGAGSFLTDAFVFAENTNLSVGAGSMKVKKLESEYTDIDCGVGSVEVILVGSQDHFSYDVDCSIGTVRLGNEKISTNKGNTSGYGKRYIHAKCSVGKIDIQFVEEETK